MVFKEFAGACHGFQGRFSTVYTRFSRSHSSRPSPSPHMSAFVLRVFLSHDVAALTRLASPFQRPPSGSTYSVNVCSLRRFKSAHEVKVAAHACLPTCFGSFDLSRCCSRTPLAACPTLDTSAPGVDGNAHTCQHL